MTIPVYLGELIDLRKRNFGRINRHTAINERVAEFGAALKQIGLILGGCLLCEFDSAERAART
jgi:hypothetical protein